MDLHDVPTVASPRDAVPSGRLGLQELGRRLRTGEPLELVTAQELGAFERLRDTGVLRVERHRAFEGFRDAYDWMADRMQQRLGHAPAPLHVPVWAWARITRRHLLQNVRRGGVLLTLRVPQSRVLLSSADEWVAVLNDSPLPGLDVPDDEYEDEWLRLDDRLRSEGWCQDDVPLQAPPALQAMWDQILDVRAYPRRHHVQACLAEVRAGDVVDAVEVAAR